MGKFTFDLPTDDTGWRLEGRQNAYFNWDYEPESERLLNLYDKGKKRQWDALERIDWTQELDPENPMQMPDAEVPIIGSDLWNKMPHEQRVELRRHMHAWRLSNFQHGEQGALICASRLVQELPDMSGKFYAATQVMDEARHIEAFSRLLKKIGVTYHINPSLQALLNDVVTAKHWDFVFIGMQVLIEGLALASFALIRDSSMNPLSKQVTAYVMEDEARHVAFGRLALETVYSEMDGHEIREREEFCLEALNMMQNSLMLDEVWERVGLSKTECLEIFRNSPWKQQYNSLIFSRIVPILKSCGLFSVRMQAGLQSLGCLHHADTDIEQLEAEDEKAADDIDLMYKRVEEVKMHLDDADIEVEVEAV